MLVADVHRLRSSTFLHWLSERDFAEKKCACGGVFHGRQECAPLRECPVQFAADGFSFRALRVIRGLRMSVVAL